MSLVTKKKWYLDYLLIIVGTGLMALAINSVFDASGLVTGGFSGIAILVKRWTGGIVDGGIPLWLTNITHLFPVCGSSHPDPCGYLLCSLCCGLDSQRNSARPSVPQ